MLSRRIIGYLKTNWGAPFVIAFLVLLCASAAEVSVAATDSANTIATYGFYALVVGVALQIASYVKYGDSGAGSPQTDEPETAAAQGRQGPGRTKKLAAIAAAILILLVGVIVGYPALSHQGGVTGCSGPRSDGELFISTNATVSIEICGQSYRVSAGADGGLTYPYHTGTVDFTAPDSANGGAFEFWYAIIGSNAPLHVSTNTLALTLPAGLSSQTSLIQLYYAAPLANISSLSSSSITAAPSSSSTSVNSTNSTATSFCRGNDGGVFLSTNLDTTVSFNICGQPALVPGGVGGGLDFGYHSGNVTLVAPVTANGMRFEFWQVIVPAEHEQIMGNQLTIYLPAGYAPGDSFIEAVYG